MAIIQTLFAALSRSLGKFLNTAFGWATILLFGKVPPERQFLLSITGFGSVAWMISVIGIAFPQAAAFLLSFVTIPDWATGYVRLVMIATALILPAVIGVLSMFALDPVDRPRKALEKLKSILRGYPYAIGLSLTLVLMCVIAPILKVRDLAKRWDSVHMPLIVNARRYSEVVEHVQSVLKDHQKTTLVSPASWLIRFPTIIFAFFARDSVNDLVAKNLQIIIHADFTILVHPSDLLISGKTEMVAQIQSILTATTFGDKAHVCWSKDGQRLEDRLNGLAVSLEGEGMEGLQWVARDIEKAKIAFDEWETLFRLQLQTEVKLMKLCLAVKPLPAPSSITESLQHMSPMQKVSAFVLLSSSLWEMCTAVIGKKSPSSTTKIGDPELSGESA